MDSMDSSGVIDIPRHEDPHRHTPQDLKLIKRAQMPETSSISTAMNSSDLAASSSLTTESTNTQSRNDHAKSQTSQIQPEAQPRHHLRKTEIENNDFNKQPHFIPSVTSQYDYGGNEDYFYADPIAPVIQEHTSFTLNPSYNFSGLQVTPLTELPQAWDSQQQFLTQVGLKLYMFVPAVAAGALLSITLWSLTMLLLRSYGWCRRSMFSKDSSQDVEMCTSSDKKIENSPDEKLPGNPKGLELDIVSRSEMVKTFSLQCESKSRKLLKSYCEEKSVSSFHPSPVSLSSATSGIGVSERDSSDKESYGDIAQTTADLTAHPDDDVQGQQPWIKECQTEDFVHHVDYTENYRRTR